MSAPCHPLMLYGYEYMPGTPDTFESVACDVACTLGVTGLFYQPDLESGDLAASGEAATIWDAGADDFLARLLGRMDE